LFWKKMKNFGMHCTVGSLQPAYSAYPNLLRTSIFICHQIVAVCGCRDVMSVHGVVVVCFSTNFREIPSSIPDTGSTTACFQRYGIRFEAFMANKFAKIFSGYQLCLYFIKNNV
jgi:hypothetical protein